MWDCVLYVFSKPERKGQLLDNRVAVRDSLVNLMQTNPAFESFAAKGTEDRIVAFEAAINEILSDSVPTDMPVAPEVRREMVDQARKSETPCAICDLLHIDHIMPLAKGGKTEPTNLRVVCKYCNQKKGAELPPRNEIDEPGNDQGMIERILMGRTRDTRIALVTRGFSPAKPAENEGKTDDQDLWISCFHIRLKPRSNDFRGGKGRAWQR